MRIGTRWGVGEEPPESLPGAIRDAVRLEEEALADLDGDTTAWGWTLTFLEDSPVVTLDDGTEITEADGEALVRRDPGV